MFAKIRDALKLVVPIVTGLAILVVLTSIVYSGGRRENLAAVAEGYLIERSIQFSEKPAKQIGKVVTVTLQNAEYDRHPHAPKKRIRDASIATYAQVLDRVLRHPHKLVLINWLNGAHFDSLDYLAPVLEVIDKHSAKDNVIITMPANYYAIAPKELIEKYSLQEGEDCVYHINRYCSVPENLTTWTISDLAKRLWTTRKPYAISYNLPHVYPNIIARFPEPSSIPDYSFSQVLGNDAPLLDLAQVVTIGNRVDQDIRFENNKEELQRAFIATSYPRRTLLQDGLPYHMFWGLLAQMFIDRSTVAVAPQGITIFLTLVVSCTIIFILFKLGSTYALGIYLFSCIAYFAFNLLAMRYLNLYVPTFDILYISLLAALSSIFIALSYNIYNQSRLEAERSGMSEKLDLKNNFLSLVTHNLNTPIAKLRGLFDVLRMRPIYQRNHDIVDRALLEISQLQVSVRSVLLSTTIEQQTFQLRSMTAQQIMEEFMDAASAILRPHGLSIEIISSDSTSTFHKEPKLLSHAILTMICDRFAQNQNLTCEVTESEEGLVSLSVRGRRRDKNRDNFMSQALGRYLEDYCRVFRAKLSDAGDAVTMTF